MKILHLITAVTFLSIPATTLASPLRDAIAQPGDPARWYQPADTPRKKYETSMKEARAALADALADCRSQSSERRSCEAEARVTYRDDVAYANALLRGDAPER